MKIAKYWLTRAWYPATLFLGATVIVSLLLWLALDSLVPGYSRAELEYISSSSAFSTVTDNPLWLPHKLVHIGLIQLGNVVPIPARSASALFGLLLAGSFYYILRNWYTKRIALLGTFLFACSAWFLHTARVGTPDITFSLLLAVTACVIWLQKPQSGSLAVMCTLLLLVFLLYVPGMIWFVIPGLLWQAKRIMSFLEHQHAAFLTCITLTAIGAIGPLGWTLYQDPALVRTYFGFPAEFLSIQQMLERLIDVPVQLFYKGPDNPANWLGRLPLLDWLTTLAFGIGLYAYFFKRRLDRTWFIAYIIAAGIILYAIGGPVTLSMIMPFIYLIAIGGLALMLQQWFTVFPKNPVARALGASLITVAIGATAYYTAFQYFIAWPNNPETRRAFSNTAIIYK